MSESSIAVFWSLKEIAANLSVSTRSVRRWINDPVKGFPKPASHLSGPRWLSAEIIAWALAQQTPSKRVPPRKTS